MVEEIKIGVVGRPRPAQVKELEASFQLAIDRICAIAPRARPVFFAASCEPVQRLVNRQAKRLAGAGVVLVLADSRAAELRAAGAALRRKSRQAAPCLEIRRPAPAGSRRQAAGAVADYIVRQCDVLVLLPDRRGLQGTAQTAAAVVHAREAKKQIVHICAALERKGQPGGPGRSGDPGGALVFENFPASAQVYWLIPAQDRLQDSLGEGNLDAGKFQARVDQLSEQLRWTFPKGQAIIVSDRIAGYRDLPHKHLLRVEVFEEGTAHARVVKIDSPDKLRTELAGWENAARPSNDRGRVFLTLQPGKPLAGRPGHYETVVYEDAYQTLRAARLVTLEQAVLDCCRLGAPPSESIDGVIDQIFAEMRDRFYKRSWSAWPDREWLRGRLQDGLEAWTTAARLPATRRQALLDAIPAEVSAFHDPCEYLKRILDEPGNLPEVRFGCAHGDLHGRNILVGIVDGAACWPAVFDYEDMDRGNLLGWDFAKLETELKIRALQVIFSGDDKQFVRSVYQFEERLALWTEENNNRPEWQPFTDKMAQPGEARLFALLSNLRHWAKRCLETLQGRSRRWLHEYYFLLACYGVYAGKFESYQARDLTCLYLCTGFAAYRFAWATSGLSALVEAAKAEAKAALERGDAKARLQGRLYISHHAPFAFACEFSRSRQEPFVRAAVEMLESLHRDYPYVLEILQELALACMELHDLTQEPGHLEAAQRALAMIDSQYYGKQCETLCRAGRYWKDRGDEAHDRDPKSDHARRCYETALDRYRQAYQIDHNYYPGINLATLLLLAGREKEALDLAKEILVPLEDTSRRWEGSEEVWTLATRAEAHLLLGNTQEAKDLYARAVRHPASEPQHRQSMANQVRRILAARPLKDWKPQDVPSLFQVPPRHGPVKPVPAKTPKRRRRGPERLKTL